MPTQAWACHPKRGALRRGGFSLIELIVAIGILSIMMLLVGQVFDLTVDSTSQATALIEINQSLRMLEANLREDLAGVVPSRSMLGIQGIPVPAYWTADQKEGDRDGRSNNGYMHEPDPERETLYGPDGVLLNGDEDINNSSVMPPYRLEHPRADILMFFTGRQTTSAVFPAVTSNAGSMVVYGHAELGELMNNGNWNPAAMPAPPERDSVAANWHLARRSVALLDNSRTTLTGMGIYGPPIGPSTATGPVTAIIEGKKDFIVRHESAVDDPGCQLFLKRLVAVDPECGTLVPALFNTIEQDWMARSRMDVTPPPSQAYRLGHYFLPNCASFKVEWAISIFGSLVWVDPADIANSVLLRPLGYYAGNTNAPWPDFEPGVGGRFDPDSPALTGPGDWSLGSTHVFLSADYQGLGPGATAPDPYFPTALRITVDMFDRAGKLVRPIRHVMVIPVGSEG